MSQVREHHTLRNLIKYIQQDTELRFVIYLIIGETEHDPDMDLTTPHHLSDTQKDYPQFFSEEVGHGEMA